MLHQKSMCVLAVIAGVALAAIWIGQEPTPAQEQAKVVVQKWEYKIVLPDNTEDPLLNQKQFDKLGDNGWELCVTHSSTRPHYCIFKRLKR